MITRRQGLFHLAALACGSAVAAPHDDWPNRTIRLVVPFAAGSPPDLIARSFLPKMAELLQGTAIVDNRPGATTTIGSEFVARAPADGYTLLLTATGAASVFPAIMKLRYDPVKDLSPVGLLATSQQIFFSGGPNRATTLDEFVARARQRGKGANIGSIGIGTTNHLACELLKKTTGIAATYVPFQSAQAGMQAVINGDVDLFCADVGVILGFMGSDRITPLAVLGSSRSEFFPQVPTLSEVGIKGVVSANRFALFAPSGMPKEIQAKLSTALAGALNREEAAASMRKMGMTATYASGDAVAEIIRNDAALMVPLAKELNIRID